MDEDSKVEALEAEVKMLREALKKIAKNEFKNSREQELIALEALFKL